MDTVFKKHLKGYKIGLRSIAMERCRIVWLNGVKVSKILTGAYTKPEMEKFRLNPRTEHIISFKD